VRKQLATSDGQAAYTLRARHLAREYRTLPARNDETAVEQHVTDLRLQLERKDEGLQAARAANRELMTQLNVSLPAQRR